MPTIRTPTGRDFLDAMRETEDDFSRACFLIFRCAYAGEERAFASVSEVLEQPYGVLRALEEELVSKMEPPVPDPT
ncbi:MAG: hypothetical protein CMJ57_09175 [Planctomycetaceae bacterium]|nr:hypothetical protein [Planctomycetaceae bacterium]